MEPDEGWVACGMGSAPWGGERCAGAIAGAGGRGGCSILSVAG